MKVIFLDIDGVLIPYGWGDCRTLAPSCVRQLQHIIAQTGAKLVISSSWRIAQFDLLMTKLDAYGLRDAVIGQTTTEILMPPGVLSMSVSRERPLEIAEWLSRHDVEAYVVLDDEKMPTTMPAVRTEPCRGLTPDHVAMAVKLLNP